MTPTLDQRWDAQARRSFAARERTFWGYVDDSNADGCWSWLGPHRGGYGCFPIVNMLLPAHRATLMYLDIEVPPTLVPDHLCEIKRCVSPNHLQVVTSSQNRIRAHRREPADTRRGTISAEVPENRLLWRRRTELRQIQADGGWRRPLWQFGRWVVTAGRWMAFAARQST